MFYLVILIIFLQNYASGFTPVTVLAPKLMALSRRPQVISLPVVTIVKSTLEDDQSPSDYDNMSQLQDCNVDNSEDKIIREELKNELLLLSSVTNRGIYASDEERDILSDIVTQLEALNPTANPARECEGEWDLCCTSTDLFRSSPFFQTIFRIAFKDEKFRNNSFSISDQKKYLLDLATSMGRVERVKQLIDVVGNKPRMRNEIGLSIGAVGGLPFVLKLRISSTAELNISGPELWEMKLKSVQIVDSNAPVIGPFLDILKTEIPVSDIYEMVGGNVPIAKWKTFYVDEGIRITRDADDNFYVFSRL